MEENERININEVRLRWKEIATRRRRLRFGLDVFLLFALWLYLLFAFRAYGAPEGMVAATTVFLLVLAAVHAIWVGVRL